MQSSENTADLNVAIDCFEVDDIAAFDPLETPAAAPAVKPPAPKSASKSKAAQKAHKPAAKPQTEVEGSTEIELSADDMDALLGDDVVSIKIS